jgi:hypothetical protein
MLKVKPNSERIKLSLFPDVDNAMEIWFRDAKHNKNVTIDGPKLQTQAINFATL